LSKNFENLTLYTFSEKIDVFKCSRSEVRDLLGN